jgi:hypothetical protein
VADALNTVDKTNLKNVICQIAILDEDLTANGRDKKIVPYSVNKKEEVVSLAEGTVRLCALE